MNYIEKMKIITLIIFILSYCSVKIFADDYHFATYNICVDTNCSNERGNGWAGRINNLCNLILYKNFDFWGNQEGKYSQLQEKVKEICPTNGNIIVSRDFNLYQTSSELNVLRNSNINNIVNTREDSFWVSNNTQVSIYGILNIWYCRVGDKIVNSIEDIKQKKRM